MVQPRINLNFARPSKTLLEQFEDKSTALLHEAMGKRGALQNDVKPVYQGATLVGSALTVNGYPGDNLMLHVAISCAQPGDVMVATVKGYTEAGIWGEIASTAAQKRGIKGLVTDGAVRDVTPMAQLGFPVFARGISIKGTTKKQAGYINIPIIIAGETVNPGDIVVGDADGVVIVPLAEAEFVLRNALRIVDKETRMLDEIKKNDTLTLDLLNLRTKLRELDIHPEEA
jgi:4-hydroxy-4-methyl-2-oxoglutarate aldolase